MTLTYSKAVHARTGEDIPTTELWCTELGVLITTTGHARRECAVTRPCSWALILPGDTVIVVGVGDATVIYISRDTNLAFVAYHSGRPPSFEEIIDLTLVINPDDPPDHRKAHPAWSP